MEAEETDVERNMLKDIKKNYSTLIQLVRGPQSLLKTRYSKYVGSEH